MKDDLIRRQAVLNTVFSMFCRWDTEDPDDLKEMLLLAFQELPPVQPYVPDTNDGDIISRQAAIDAVRASTSKYTGFMEMEMYTDDDAVEAISGVPSVQPEIVRCGQCKYAEVADKEDAQDGYTCQFHRGNVWFSGSYCSWAERRTNGTTD